MSLTLRGDEIIGLRRWEFDRTRRLVYIRDDIPHARWVAESSHSILKSNGARYVETNVFIQAVRHSKEYPFEIYIAGAHPAGCAQRVNFAHTFEQAVEKARSLVLPEEENK